MYKTTKILYSVFIVLMFLFGFSQITFAQNNREPNAKLKAPASSTYRAGVTVNNVLAGVCNNLDFESGSFASWTGGIGYNPNTNGPLSITSGAISTLGANSPEPSCSFHTLVNGGNDPYSGLTMVDPGGGNWACRLGGEVLNLECDYYNNASPNYIPGAPAISNCTSNDPGVGVSSSFSNGETIQQTFPVTAANCLFAYNYAVVLSDAPHTGKENPYFSVQVYDHTGALIPCLSYFVEADTTGAGGVPPGFQVSGSTDQLGNSVLYTPWTQNSLNLQPYIGTNVTVKFTAAGCTQGGHFCYAYIDCTCGPLELVVPSGPVCTGLTQTITGPSNGVGGTYSWTGPGIVSGATTQTITANQPGTYSVTVTNQKGCAYTIDTSITFYATPTLTVNSPTLCTGGATTITVNSTGSAGTLVYTWNPTAGLTFSPGDSVAVFNPASNATFNITGTSAHGCTNTAVANVTVNNIPPPTFTAPPVCNGTQTVFTTTTTAAVYSWNFGDLSTLADTSHLQNPTYLYPTSGNYVVNFSVTTAAGCKSSVTQTVTVNPMPLLSFSTTPVCDQSPVCVTNTTPAQGSFTVWAWDYGDGAGTSAAAAPGCYTYAAPGIYTITLTASTASGCSGTVTATATVHPNPIASGSVTNVCLGTGTTFTDASSIINPAGLNDNITSWNWSYGDGGNGPTSSPTHTYAACGVYTVSLTVKTNFNCTDVITGTDTVFCLPQVTAPPSFSICPATAVTSAQTTFNTTCAAPAWGVPAAVVFVNNPNPTNNTTTTHGGIPLADTVDINSIPNYNAITPNLSCGLLVDTVYGYAVTIVGNNIACIGNVPTFTISVYPTPYLAHMITDSICANQTITIPSFTACPANSTIAWTNNNTTIGLGANGNGNIGPFIGTNTTNTLNIGQINATPTANGCVGNDSTFSIVIKPLPTMTVSSFTACPKDVIPAATITTDPAAGVNYTWANNNTNIGLPLFGVGAQPTYTAPVNATLVNVMGVLTYTPTLNACKGPTTTETIVIKPTPFVDPVPASFYCPNQVTNPINFTCQPTGGTPVFTYTVPGGIGQTGTGSVPSFTTINSGTTDIVTTFTVNATLNNCQGPNSTFNITVYPNPKALFTYKPLVCEGSPMVFTNESVAYGGLTLNSWQWDMDNNGSIDATSQNPQYTIPTVGLDSVKLYVGTSSVPSCTAEVTEPVFVNPKPVPNFVGVNLQGCPTLQTAFTDQSTVSLDSIVSWNWNFGNGQTSNSHYPQPQNYVNTSNQLPAYYTISLIVTTDSGCVGSKVKTNYVEVYPRPIADFSWGPVGTDIDAPKITFFNTAVGASPFLPAQTYGQYGVEYYLGDTYASGSSSNYVHNNTSFTHSYNDPDPNDVTETYYVTQWVINSYGCTDSITKPVEILPIFTFYIPNAFTPDGDGKNEGFKGLGIGINNSTYNLWVFDRWGLMIYHATDIDKAWDGHMLGHEDKPILQEDVYVWKVKFNDIFGQLHEYHGTVTLVK